jgi:site-specific DNA recombinase
MAGRAPYTRLSSDRGKISDSIPNQRKEEEEYFEQQGWPWDESLYFSDNDLSASKYATKARPGYLELLAVIRAGRVELILVTEVSRLFRNLADAIELLNLFRSTSLRWVETTGGARYDLTTVQGEHNLLEAVVGASRESGNTSDRVKRAKRASAREGYWAGGIRPYGYERMPVVDERGTVTRHSGLAPVPEEAAIVREVVARIFHGETLTRIAHDLNARGIPTAKGTGRWQDSLLRQLLGRPVLKGVRVHHGTEYPGEVAGDHHARGVGARAAHHRGRRRVHRCSQQGRPKLSADGLHRVWCPRLRWQALRGEAGWRPPWRAHLACCR